MLHHIADRMRVSGGLGEVGVFRVPGDASAIGEPIGAIKPKPEPKP